jgi:hypothetical protein
MRAASLLVTLAFVPFAAVAADVADRPPRPVIHQLPPAAAARLPSPGDLVRARGELKRRLRGPLSHTETATGASAAAAFLIDAAGHEDDRAMKWLLLLEARRLAAAAGNAATVARAVVLASATYEFDAVAEEYRSLAEIPLRGIDEPRAGALAQVAEQLSLRAEAEGRTELAADAQALAVRAWQRAGDMPSARRADARLAVLDPPRPATAPAGRSATGSDTLPRVPSGGSAR